MTWPGVLITGGHAELTSAPQTIGVVYLKLDTANKKGIQISGSDTSVAIHSTNTTSGSGITIYGKNGEFTMSGGTLTINIQGKYGGTGINNQNGTGTVYATFTGGKTEITTVGNQSHALQYIESLTFGDNYIHKNYAGTSAADRTATEDDKLLIFNSSTYSSKPYVLITPANSITYNIPDDSTLPSGIPTVYTEYDGSITVTQQPTRSGYTFKGWTGDNGNKPQLSITIPAGSTGNRTYTANWDGLPFTVRFYSNFDLGTYQEQQFTYGEAQNLKANDFSRTGYTFTGWNTVGQPTTSNPGTPYDDLASLLVDGRLPNDQMSLWAQWRINSHTISYQYTGDNVPGEAPAVPNDDTAAYKSSQTVAAAPGLAGYTFSGWSGETKGGQPVTVNEGNAFEMPDDDVIFSGSWTANTYSVVFHANNGTTDTVSQSFTYDAAQALTINSFTYDRHSFSGWNTLAAPTADDPGQAYSDEQSVSNLTSVDKSTVDLYAQWDTIIYGVTITPGKNMTKTEDSGEISQNVTDAITDVVFTANEGYYFPADYSVSAFSGISVTRNSFTQITVSGTPEDLNTAITLADAVKKEQEPTPAAVFSAAGTDCGTLTNAAAGMKYSVDGGLTWIDISGTGVSIASGVTAADGIMVYRPGNGATTVDSDAQSITVSKAAVPAAPAAVDCTSIDNSDGKLTGITAAMEYRKSDSETWTAGTGNDITGLAPGTYYIRIRAVGATLASENQELAIAAYTAPDQVAAPVFSPAAGSYSETQAVTITCATEGATIFYTVDGSDDGWTAGHRRIDQGETRQQRNNSVIYAISSENIVIRS